MVSVAVNRCQKLASNPSHNPQDVRAKAEEKRSVGGNSGSRQSAQIYTGFVGYQVVRTLIMFYRLLLSLSSN